MVKNISMFFLLLGVLLIGHANCLCTPDDKEMLTTFHPHLDAFWLNFDNQLKDINFRPAGFLYDMNQRNSKTILNSMLQALTQNSSRKYFITEIVFFKDWYDYLTPQKQKQAKMLLENGQFQIANGAWVENDEAVCYFDDILDQYTIGHEFMYKNFDYQIKIGWATDSFGHSHSQVALEHLLGIQFQGIERVDDRYVNQHNNGPLLQFFWTPFSDSNNRTYGGVLNHVRHFLHEVNNFRRTPKTSIISDYKTLEQTMMKAYGKNKLFRFLGNDFEEFIPSQFETLEQSLKQLNQGSQSSCPAFKYGNPQDYLKLIEDYYTRNQLRTRRYDFMPNWDQDRYWTGYYTTDPYLKKICKDFSRLINLYRKILLTENIQEEKFQRNLLTSAQELLAVVQHHDGITATSKTYIEDEFCNRMEKKSSEIMSNIQGIYNVENKNNICELYKNKNSCEFKKEWINDISQPITLNILTLGNPKVETISIVNLPNDIYLTVQGAKYDIFCQEQVCKVLFDATLFPGVNQFKFQVQSKEKAMPNIIEMQKQNDFKYDGLDYTVMINEENGEILYNYGVGKFFSFGFYTSENKGGTRSSKAWSKYGKQTNKVERIMPGMYIMFNTGKTEKLFNGYNSMSVGIGKIYRKFIFKLKFLTLELTIKNDQLNIVDVDFTFKPERRTTLDYFLKVSSNIQSSTLYHDSNGYLVSKRQLNMRPDYSFEPHPDDIINGNTYPVTAFAYLRNNNQKFVFFSDRAQGVCAYNQSLLINFDRLTFDDGKGAGQSYMKMKQNSFHYKFAVFDEKKDIQRIWQRQYDEATIGIFSSSLPTINKRNINKQFHEFKDKYLKYTVFHLNENEIVLRLMNLAEYEQLMVMKYDKDAEKGRFVIETLGLDLKFVDIAESYANGIPKQQDKNIWRLYWGTSDEQINIATQCKSDTDKFLTLRPLQIRSFRINFKQKIPTPQNKNNRQPNHPTGPPTSPSMVTINKRKHCF